MRKHLFTAVGVTIAIAAAVSLAFSVAETGSPLAKIAAALGGGA